MHVWSGVTRTWRIRQSLSGSFLLTAANNNNNNEAQFRAWEFPWPARSLLKVVLIQLLMNRASGVPAPVGANGICDRLGD